jgi:hypothetical protein
MKHTIAIVLMALAITASAQQSQTPPARPANPAPTPQQTDQRQVIEMQIQRDQAAETALRNILSQLQEFRDWLQFKAEIEHLQEQLQQLRPQQPPPPTPPPHQP